MRTHSTRKTAASRPASAAIEYFTRKLEFDVGPYTLQHIMDETPGDILVVDVRDAAAYEKEHIRSAVSIPLAEIGGKLESLPRDKVIVTYCGDITCPLSAKAALELAKAGFTVQHLVGGIAEWTKRGYPVDSARQDSADTAAKMIGEGEGGPME